MKIAFLSLFLLAALALALSGKCQDVETIRIGNMLMAGCQ